MLSSFYNLTCAANAIALCAGPFSFASYKKINVLMHFGFTCT